MSRVLNELESKSSCKNFTLFEWESTSFPEVFTVYIILYLNGNICCQIPA